VEVHNKQHKRGSPVVGYAVAAEIYTAAVFHIVAEKVDYMMAVPGNAASFAATHVAAVAVAMPDEDASAVYAAAADRADDDRVAAVYNAAVLHTVAEKVDNMMMDVAAVVVAVAASFAATLVASVAVAVPAADAPAVHAAAADRVDTDLAAAGILSAVRQMGPRSKAAVIEGNNHSEE
jgi:hypothetical protein